MKHDASHLLDAAVLLLAGAIVGVGVALRADASARPLALPLALAAAAVLVLRRRAPSATLAVSGGLVLALFAVDHASASVAVIAIPVLAAEALRNRRSYVQLLLERLQLAEQTREEEAQRRAEQERLRIARDLHDVVAHTLTTINVQAGVAAHLLDREPSRAGAALTTIEAASHEALDELRAILGVLRERDTADVPLDPAPSLDGVSLLVDRFREAGGDIELEVDGEPPERVSDAVQLAAFRIVQESLTNARRHAPGAAARVRLAYADDRLRVGIENDLGQGRNGNGRGPGVGIAGMHERATALGGTVEAGPCGDGFKVTAELPYRRSA